MVTGGLRLEALPPEERARQGLADGSMALRVQHVGQYGAHAAAKSAGFRQGDVIVEFDGRSDLLTESAVLSYGAAERRPGDRIAVTILRAGERRTLELPMQP
jgi:S1-C subfamily serine protease